MAAVRPLLVLGWGNAARGDDALGPLFIDALAARLGPSRAERCELLLEHQLQPEHALDLVGRDRLLFVDASTTAQPPFEVHTLHPAPDATLSSHALSPAALLQVYRQLQQADPPHATLLALPARRFGLGTAPSAQGLAAVQAAVGWALDWIDAGGPGCR